MSVSAIPYFFYKTQIWLIKQYFLCSISKYQIILQFHCCPLVFDISLTAFHLSSYFFVDDLSNTHPKPP